MHTHIYTNVKYKLQRQTLTRPDSTQPPECVQLENEAVHLKLDNGAVHLQGQKFTFQDCTLVNWQAHFRQVINTNTHKYNRNTIEIHQKYSEQCRIFVSHSGQVNEAPRVYLRYLCL